MDIMGFRMIKLPHGERMFPCNLTFIQKLWWYFMPGSIVRVKWPSGEITVDHNDPRWCDLGGAARIKLYSADPSDWYRPFLEKHVGKQGWDWDWGMGGHDATENMITIKIRRKHEKYSTMIGVMWS